MITAALVIGATAHVRVPSLIGLTRSQARARSARLSLTPSFSSRYDRAPKGSVIGQVPGARARVLEGSTVQVVLSAGPPPVRVPQLAGEQVTQARATLAGEGLGARTTVIVAPGVPAGTVTSQSPAPGSELAPPKRVALEVAETPRWQPLTSLMGSGEPTTVQLRVRGTQWRIVYTMAYQGTCTFIFFCSGPQAQVASLQTGSTVASFGLGDGGRQTRLFGTGAGSYRLTVSPGSDTARWQLWVEDYY